ncbi:hypothetical protein BB561_005553 [Smittium simulii]|uniref:Pacifastin domain-containing protein n=1 Tax=Smittium simulii TaxID=133385 RepID=A0A2T9Y9R6_9FUNG|nr:hypothetical protein BB561_005553 [Smittium simulii]
MAINCSTDTTFKPDAPKDGEAKPDAKENLDIKDYNKCVSKNGKSVFESAENKCNSCICTEIGKVCCLKTKCEEPDFNKTEKYKGCIKNFGSKNFPYPAGECSQCQCSESGDVICTPGLCSSKKPCNKSKPKYI